MKRTSARYAQYTSFPAYPAAQPANRPDLAAPYPVAHRRKAQSVFGLPHAVITLAFLGLLILAPLTAGLAYISYTRSQEQIAPGVFVGETQLGDKTVEEAAVAIQIDWNHKRSLVLEAGEQKISVRPSDLGLGVDALQTAQEAYRVAHGQNVLAEAGQRLQSLTSGWGVAPVVTFDPQAARLGLEALTLRLTVAPQDATFRLDGTQLIAVPAVPGATLDVDQTLATLAADPRAAVINGRLPVALKPVPAPRSDVSAALASAQKLLDTPFTLHGYDPITNQFNDWPVPRATLAGWLTVEQTAQGPTLAVSAERVAGFVSELNQQLGPERFIDPQRYTASLTEAVQQGQPAVVLLNHKPTTYTVEAGDTLLKVGWKVQMPYWRIAKANPQINPDKLVAGDQLVIPSKDDLLPLPVVANKRIVISISKQHLWAYQDGKEVQSQVISTGIDRSPTQPGVFQVQTHELDAYASLWNLHMPHFMGIYEAWPGFMNGIHGLPTLSNGTRLWANILGKPASYGCIILKLDAAEWLYNWAEAGVVVEIQP